MVDKLMRWYTKGASFPIKVELLECLSDDCWLIVGPNGVFEISGRFLYWEEREAWEMYLGWIKGVWKYMESFGIQDDFFVMKDLSGRYLHAKTHLENLGSKGEE